MSEASRLLIQQRDDARAALERVAGERDEALSAVQRTATLAAQRATALVEMQQERDEARAEVVRLGKALEAIHQKWKSTHDAWHPDTKYASDAADSWHQGYVTALATTSIMARQALDPDAEDEWGKDVEAARGTDRMWFERTGNCGHCGLIAEDCDCRPDDPCGCGPHELRTVPRPCWRCKGSGWDHPRGVSVDQAVLPIDEVSAATARLRDALDEERIEPKVFVCQNHGAHPHDRGFGEAHTKAFGARCLACPDCTGGRTEGEAG